MNFQVQRNPIYVYGISTFVALLVVTGVFAGGDILLAESYALHGDTPAPTSKILVAVFTVLGVLSKKIYDRFQNPPNTSTGEKSEKKLSIGSILKSIVAALLVSPFVIISLYKTLAEIPDELLVFLLCYQNGFFWQSITGGKDI